MTKQQIEQAINEFGDLAYQRFTDDKGMLFESNDDLNRELSGWASIKPKPIIELFKHGVKLYGFDTEVKKWQFRGYGGWQKIPNFATERHVLNAMRDRTYKHRRKPTKYKDGTINDFTVPSESGKPKE